MIASPKLEVTVGYSEDQAAAAARERQQVRMGNADPGNLSTISGNMAMKAQQAAQSSASSSPWPSDPIFPVSYPTSPSVQDIPYGDDPLPSALPRVRAPRRPAASPRPQVPDWTDRAMQRIPTPVIVICAVLGALIGFAAGASSGGAAALVYALFGAGAGMLALPAAIKLLQLALRIVAVGAVIALFLLIIWALTHASK